MRPFNILVIEDDDVDFMNVERSFKKINLTNPIVRAEDGIEALDKLRNTESIPPTIIFLDLSMPRMDGHEFLDEIRTDEKLKHLPIIVMTVSTEESDKIKAYNNNVQGYIVKPMRFDDFVEIVTTVNAYWTMCELP